MESNPPLQFNPGDFQSFTWAFVVTNLTSRQPVQPTHFIRVVEIAKRGLTLNFPARSCAAGHQLQFRADVQVPGTIENAVQPPIIIVGTARVEKVENQGSDEDLVEIVFQQIEEAAWSKIHELLARRQNSILEFFRSVKGEE